jgi:hypothetical protein
MPGTPIHPVDPTGAIDRLDGFHAFDVDRLDPPKAGEALHAQDGAIILADEETVEMCASGEPGAFCSRTTRRPSTSSWTCGTRRTPRSIGAQRPLRHRARPRLRAPRLRRAVTRAGGLRPASPAPRFSIQPLQRIDDQRWVWHVDLDSEASALLNDLHDGKEVDEARRTRLLAMFRCEFRDPADMLERVCGRPVYLGLAMMPAPRLKLNRTTC